MKVHITGGNARNYNEHGRRVRRTNTFEAALRATHSHAHKATYLAWDRSTSETIDDAQVILAHRDDAQSDIAAAYAEALNQDGHLDECEEYRDIALRDEQGVEITYNVVSEVVYTAREVKP